MKIIKNTFSFFIVLFYLIDNNTIFAATTSSIEMPYSVGGTNLNSVHNLAFEHVVNITNRLLGEFRHQYPQFDYGIKSMEGLYDTVEDLKEIYDEMKEHTHARSLVFAGEILTGGACEVIKSLSVFHPESQGYGYALIGLYMTKSILWGIDSWLYDSDRGASTEIINILQTDPLLASHVSAVSSQITGIDFSPVMDIAGAVINLMKREDLSVEDIQKLRRLETLNKKLQNTNSTKKVFLVGGKILSFLTGIAAGISISATGQDSSPSYWLTLLAGGFDSIIDNAHTTITKKPITQRYITISEVLYLSDYFLRFYRSDEV